MLQLKIMLHALGYFRPAVDSLPIDEPGADAYGPDAMEAVDRFRADQRWATAVHGFVDARTMERLWSRLEEEGLAVEVRERLLEIARVTR